MQVAWIDNLILHLEGCSETTEHKLLSSIKSTVVTFNFDLMVSNLLGFTAYLYFQPWGSFWLLLAI